ncbi:hypothetical protein N7478_008393 [Penicillium angulare]|uniref:uncharacterized protein n=1 Tax=Penicillium angulare TaxID=116970 RepID=UPI0025405EC5|nr:uncharacterized protein N7478_008393 [Penicillium angulare]KAJ5273268.1 hypothetical protein N7478_008393 [Penicillium angulare]
MRFHSVLLWLACLTSTVTSSVILGRDDKTLYLQRGVERAKNIIPDSEKFLNSPDQKKAKIVLRDISSVRTFAKFQALSIQDAQHIDTPECDKLSSLWKSLSDHVIEASPIMSTVGSNPNLASWTGGMTNSLKRDMEIDIFHMRAVFDTTANPVFYPLLRQLQTKCSEFAEGINIEAKNAVLALDEVQKSLPAK